MTLSSEDIKHGAIAGLVGGVVLSLVFQFGTDVLPRQASVYGITEPGLALGWGVNLVHATILGVVYVAVADRYVDRYLDSVLVLTRNSAALTKAFMPLMDALGMAVLATSAMGLLFGVALWVIIGVIALPALAGTAVPAVSGIVLLGYLLYGITLGSVYGLQMRQ